MSYNAEVITGLAIARRAHQRGLEYCHAMLALFAETP